MPELGRGACIGRYVILDRLGMGGMGVVYRAYDPDLDRRVALKLVRDLSDETTARLIREGQALAKVSHPNIVQVFDVGVFADTVFVAMELVEGRTLVEWHREDKPGWRATLDHLIAAARGLAAAHAAGLIHRDFKPNNAIVGADGRVRVLDFGLARVTISAETPSVETPSPFTTPSTPSGVSAVSARVLASRSGQPTASTALEIPERQDPADTEEDDAAGLPRVVASRVIGTPLYMAPEQRRRGSIDSRADQFAFAVTAWELLYGERPFPGDSAAEYAASAARHALRPAPPGSNVPAWVRRVLVRALSPAPSDRYRSMDELIAALSADPAARWRRIGIVVAAAAIVGAGAVALATGPDDPEPCTGAERHLAGVWDDAAARRLEAALAGAGGAGATYARDTAAKVRGALDGRARAWVTMHREACLATRVRGEQSAELLDLRMACLERRRAELGALVAELTGGDRSRVAGAIAAVRALPDVAACADREELTAVVPPPTDATSRAVISEQRDEHAAIRALVATGQYREGRDRAERAEQRARQLGWAPLEAEASFLRGLAERHAGDLEAAEAALTDAGRAAARAHLDDLAAEAWSELVWLVGYEGARPAEGLALATAAEAIAARAEATPSVRAGLHHARAMTLYSRGDLDAALVEAQRAAELEPDSDEALNAAAMIESAKGEYARAEATHRRVLAIRRAGYGEQHPMVADSLDNLGVVVYHQGRHDEARALYEQALAVRVAALGPDHRDVGTSHNNLGGLLLDVGDEDGARTHLERALAIYEGVLGPDHADLAIPLTNLGDLAIRRGDWSVALALCERALRLDETAAGPDDPDLAYDLVCVGEARLGRGDDARPVLERALRLREKADADPGELARTRFDLARALWKAGQRSRARALAVLARDAFARLGDAWKDRHATVVTWLGNPR